MKFLGPLVAVAAAFAAACTAIVGVTTVPQPETSSADGGDDASDAAIDWMACLADGDLQNACFLCEDQACCGPELGCQGSAPCQTYETCAKACGEQGTYAQCTLECSAENQAGHSLFAPLQACVTYHCFAPCGQAQNDPCSACLQASCADEAYACESNPDCDILNACTLGCSDAGSNIQGCVKICTDSASAEAQKLYQPLYACETQNCMPSCGSLP
jgi:hypothetical protein